MPELNKTQQKKRPNKLDQTAVKLDQMVTNQASATVKLVKAGLPQANAQNWLIDFSI